MATRAGDVAASNADSSTWIIGGIDIGPGLGPDAGVEVETGSDVGSSSGSAEEQEIRENDRASCLDCLSRAHQ